MSVKTYQTEDFSRAFMQHVPEGMLQESFETFFMVRVEEMFALMKLPVPPARARNHTLIWLTEGEGHIRIGSEDIRFVPGHCVIVPAGQVFSYSIPDVNKGFLCHFHEDFLTGKQAVADLHHEFRFLHAWAGHRIDMSGQAPAFITGLLLRMLDIYRQQGLRQAGLLRAHLFSWLREISLAFQHSEPAQAGQAFKIASSFRALLHTHFRTEHQVAAYASLLHVSPNHLNKCLKEVTGKSPSRWIEEILVLEARVLLSQTSLSVGEISATIGLMDASYFSRLFKKHEGCSPLVYRKTQT